MSLPSLAIGIVLALLAVYLYSKAQRGAVASPLLATRIDLNPAIYSYPGVSTIGSAYA